MALTKATPDVLSKAYVEKTADTENVIGGTIALEEDAYTIASGAITPTRSNIELDAEGAGTTDTLDRIVTTSLSDDTIIILSVALNQVITINDAGGAAGQIHLIDDTDFVMSGDERLCLIRDDADWYELWRSTKRVGSTIQRLRTQLGTYTNLGTTAIVVDTSIMEKTEGNAVSLDVAITPTNASSILIMDAVIILGHADSTIVAAGLFKDADTNALAMDFGHVTTTTSAPVTLHIRYEVAAGDTSPRTYKIRAGGGNANSSFLNGGATTLFGGASVFSSLTVTEVLA